MDHQARATTMASSPPSSPVRPHSPVRPSPSSGQRMPPPSPRDMRLAMREQHKMDVTRNMSMDYTPLEQCDKTMFKQCQVAKIPISQRQAEGVRGPQAKDTGGPPATSRQKLHNALFSTPPGEEVVLVSRLTPNSSEERSNSDEHHCSSSEERNRQRDQLSRVLDRGGLHDPNQLVSSKAVHECFKRVSSDGSSDEPISGLDNGRRSRVAGKRPHSTMSHANSVARSLSVAHSVVVRPSSSRASVLNRTSSCGSLSSHSMSGLQSTQRFGSFTHSSRALETPPGAADAFEAGEPMHRVCPAPTRRSVLTTSVQHTPAAHPPPASTLVWE